MSPNLRPYTIKEAEIEISGLLVRAQKALINAKVLELTSIPRAVLLRDRLERAVLQLENL